MPNSIISYYRHETLWGRYDHFHLKIRNITVLYIWNIIVYLYFNKNKFLMTRRLKLWEVTCYRIYTTSLIVRARIQTKLSCSKILISWDFPGGPVVKTLCFHWGGVGSIPGLELRAHMVCCMAKKIKSSLWTALLN